MHESSRARQAKESPTFYRFPRSRVSIAATPKTGRTSVLTYLLDLEVRLGSEEKHSHPNALAVALRTSDENPSGAAVPHLDKRLEGYVVGEKTPVEEGELRLATVRDPADRIASCWLDKLVDGPAAWQAKYYSENWFPSDFRTPEAMEASFLTFLKALRGDHVLLRSDPHWAPQSWMLRHWRGARCVTTEELTDLPTIVTERLDALAGTPTAPMPHKHRTENWLKQFVLTPVTQSLIGEIYSLDYEFLETHCATYRPVTPSGFTAEDALRLPAFDREVHVRRNQRLSRSLGVILERAVWRRRVDAYERET